MKKFKMFGLLSVMLAVTPALVCGNAIPARAEIGESTQTNPVCEAETYLKVQNYLEENDAQLLSEAAAVVEETDGLWEPSTMTDGNQQAYVISYGTYAIPLTDGTTENVHSVLYQWADVGESIAVTSACTHSNKKKIGTTDMRRVHGVEHPGYCSVYFTERYYCNSCKTNWTQTTHTSVWCTSASIIDEVPETFS